MLLLLLSLLLLSSCVGEENPSMGTTSSETEETSSLDASVHSNKGTKYLVLRFTNGVERFIATSQIEHIDMNGQGDPLIGSAWKVAQKPGYYHHQPWEFFADGKVQATGYWQGKWVETGALTYSISVIQQGVPDTFSIQLSPDRNSFKGYKAGVIFRYGDRIRRDDQHQKLIVFMSDGKRESYDQRFIAGFRFAARNDRSDNDGLIASWSAESHSPASSGLNPGDSLYGKTVVVSKGVKAFRFNGSSDEINIVKPTALNLGRSDFSIEAWVKTEQVGASSIFMNYAGVPMYALTIDATGRPQFAFRPSRPSLVGRIDGNPLASVGTKRAVNDDQWHHIVGVRSGASALIYMDGILENESTNHALLEINGGSVDTSGCRYARIGAIHSAAGHCRSATANSHEAHFEGLIAEVNIYNRALSADEISRYSVKKGD